MSLPIIVEVAIGLLFVYLILSLLASEIQETVGSLLQWRAEHLKRSIEVLLAGNDADNRSAATDLADQLYDSPLIRSLNQEATGPIGKAFRLLNQSIGSIYRMVTRSRNVFGSKTSGPSYIPSSFFAKSLIERLQLGDIRNLLVNFRLYSFIEDKLMLPINHIINDLRASTANEFLLNTELRQLESEIGQIIQDFKRQHTNLSEAIDRLIDRLDDFIRIAQEVLPDNHHLTETFIRRLNYLRRSISNTILDKSALLKKLRPSLQEIITVLDQNSQLYQELQGLGQRGDKEAQTILDYLKSQPLPSALKNSLNSLAQNVQLRLTDLDEDVSDLTSEVESWFDQSMERAGGVYRRNAKAVGFLVGFSIAIALNVDSLHMLERFFIDPTIRQAVSRSAEQFAVESSNFSEADKIQTLQTSVDETLQSLPLPMGYQAVVIEQQAQAEERWSFPVPRRFIGWLVTGIAISMGAGFWFNLLKKVVGVRNTGKPPEQS
jgi:hypothetical protein